MCRCGRQVRRCNDDRQRYGGGEVATTGRAEDSRLPVGLPECYQRGAYSSAAFRIQQIVFFKPSGVLFGVERFTLSSSRPAQNRLRRAGLRIRSASGSGDVPEVARQVQYAQLVDCLESNAWQQFWQRASKTSTPLWRPHPEINKANSVLPPSCLHPPFTFLKQNGLESPSGQPPNISTMASYQLPPPSLDTMPEEILSQIVAPLLPLKWYSLSVLVSLSQTSSSLRTWLLEDESIWNKALLGRGMGRPLYTIPGYEGFPEWEKEIREAHRKIREKAALEKPSAQHEEEGATQSNIKKPMMVTAPQAQSPTDASQHKTGRSPMPPSAVYHHGGGPDAMDCDNESTDEVEDYAFPITCRDLCFRIYAHERKCLSCKVGDSKLSHYYLTDNDLRNADKVGVHPTILKFMGNNWGFGSFEPAHFDKVLNVREARTRAVSRAAWRVRFCDLTTTLHSGSNCKVLRRL